MFAKEQLVDGNLWKNMSNQEKIFYLSGFSNGLAAAIAYIDPAKVDSLLYSYYPKDSNNLSINSEIQDIDKFYIEERNSEISVPFALQMINLEKKGATTEEINELRGQIIATNP